METSQLLFIAYKSSIFWKRHELHFKLAFILINKNWQSDLNAIENILLFYFFLYFID